MISFITYAKGRLNHLERVYSANVAACPDSEFILLNWNSPDELDAFACSLPSNVKYFKTTVPTDIHMSRAKNVAAKQATGDIFVFLDADADIAKTPGVEAWLENKFTENLNRLIIGSKEGVSGGRVAISRDHFYTLGGIDEIIDSDYGYGGEMRDLRLRAERKGLAVDYWTAQFGTQINHSDIYRVRFARSNSVAKMIAAAEVRVKANTAANVIVANEGREWGEIQWLRMPVDFPTQFSI